jgi:hypothetical protein
MNNLRVYMIQALRQVTPAGRPVPSDIGAGDRSQRYWNFDKVGLEMEYPESNKSTKCMEIFFIVKTSSIRRRQRQLWSRLRRRLINRNRFIAVSLPKWWAL